jgi:hypothetical protein
MAVVKWTKRLRATLSSTANVTGDWFYYFYLIDISVPNMDNDFLRAAFLIICLASSFFGALKILVVGFSCNKLIGCRTCCKVTARTWVSMLELLLEDIPQLVVTSLVSYHVRGPLSPQAVFNLTTSSINFALDALDIVDELSGELIDEDASAHGGDEEANDRSNALLY